MLLLSVAGGEHMCISGSRQRVFQHVSGRTPISKELAAAGRHGMPYLNPDLIEVVWRDQTRIPERRLGRHCPGLVVSRGMVSGSAKDKRW